jgi:hypothetical protein
MEKTHFKKLRNPNYIGSYELANGNGYNELTVEITAVKQESVNNGDKTEMCMVVHLKGVKPMICNSTNAKNITKATGSPYVEDWIGKRITLYVAKVRAFGETHDALRVRDKAPQPTAAKPKQALNPSSDKWSSAVESIKTRATTIEKIKSHYTISAEDEQKLINESKETIQD